MNADTAEQASTTQSSRSSTKAKHAFKARGQRPKKAPHDIASINTQIKDEQKLMDGPVEVSDKVMLDGTPAADGVDSPSKATPATTDQSNEIPPAKRAGDDAKRDVILNMRFDEDMHKIAAAHLQGLCPLTSASIEYVTLSNKLSEAHDELDWVSEELRDLDDAQFSLSNMRLHRLVSTKPMDDPDRESLVHALAANDKAWSNTRHRLRTRDRRTRSRIEKYRRAQYDIEHAQLVDWELVKLL